MRCFKIANAVLKQPVKRRRRRCRSYSPRKPTVTELRSVCNSEQYISEEGIAAAELFDGVKNDIKNWGLEAEWLEKVITITKRAMVYYPPYLKGQKAVASDFAKLDLDILRMQADGYSVTEIAKMLELNSRTVKYHVQENYKRLGVSGKAEAILTARNLKLL